MLYAGLVIQENRSLLGRSQVVKAPGFDPGMRRFESYRPSQFHRFLIVFKWRYVGKTSETGRQTPFA